MPNNGAFNDIEEYTYALLVEGTPASTADGDRSQSAKSPLSFMATDDTNSSSYGKSGFSKKYNSCNIKIVKAEKTVSAGKTDFIPSEVTYIELTPSNANVDYVQSCVRSKWGEAYVIVSNDGLPIGDSSATRGMNHFFIYT